MKYHSFLLLVFCVVTVSAVAAAGFVSSGPGYHLAKKTVLGGEGGWDYLYCDSAARRIYLSRTILRQRESLHSMAAVRTQQRSMPAWVESSAQSPLEASPSLPCQMRRAT